MDIYDKERIESYKKKSYFALKWEDSFRNNFH